MSESETAHAGMSILEELRQAQEGRESLMISLRLADAGLETAAERFREYAALHAAKGTPEADEKAQRNADMAYSLDCCRPGFAEDADQPLLKDDWQPIESAPRDGTRVLMWGGGWDGPQTHEWPTAERSAEELRHWHNPPTHWMPLPAPPTDPTLAEEKGDHA